MTEAPKHDSYLLLLEGQEVLVLLVCGCKVLPERSENGPVRLLIHVLFGKFVDDGYLGLDVDL